MYLNLFPLGYVNALEIIFYTAGMCIGGHDGFINEGGAEVLWILPCI